MEDNSEDELRRIFTLKLATVHEDEEPTRRRASRSEFTDEEWRLVTQARSWLTKRGEDLLTVDWEFIDQSAKREIKARAWARRLQALVYLLLLGVIAGLIGWINQSYLKDEWNWFSVMRPHMVANFRPHVLSADRERALRPGDSFQECAKDCPEMVVVPAGEFTMGSPSDEKGHDNLKNEWPQHRVTIAKPFAVSKFAVTFADWDACVSVGGCPKEGRAVDTFAEFGPERGGCGEVDGCPQEQRASDTGSRRAKQPLTWVSWDDAKTYTAWLSKMTGKEYRLLTEAEYEYAARAGTTTAYYWGEEIGNNNANCRGCGQWGGRQTAPVGSFAANAFGLYDMLGNVFEWVEDCYHRNYNGAPMDGSAWTADCINFHVIRGGGWDAGPLAHPRGLS